MICAGFDWYSVCSNTCLHFGDASWTYDCHFVFYFYLSFSSRLPIHPKVGFHLVRYLGDVYLGYECPFWNGMTDENAILIRRRPN